MRLEELRENGVTEGLVFYSNRRNQYANRGYQKMLAEHEIERT